MKILATGRTEASTLSGAGLAGELPTDARTATDWFRARIIGRAPGAGVTDTQSIKIRSLHKALKRWTGLSNRGRRKLWDLVLDFLKVELEVTPQELSRPIRALHGSVELKHIHEMDSNQRAELAVRKAASLMLAQNIPPAVILRQLNPKRSRTWLNNLARRIKSGDSELLDRRTGNSGVKRHGETPLLLLEDLAFDPLRKPPVTTIHKHLRAQCEKHGVEAPSLGWVRGQLKNVPQLKLLHDIGAEQYRKTNRPMVLTKDTGVVPGELYEIDSTTLDVYVRYLLEDGEWDEVRPTLTCVIDVGSRAVVGMHLTIGAPTEVSVAQAFLHAVLPKSEEGWPMHGKPQILRMDRGPEYGNEFINAVRACGVSVEWSPPHYPDARAKGERFFGTLNTFIHGLPGTTKAIGNLEKAVRKALPALYTVEQLLEAIKIWVRFDYHFAFHRGINALPARLWATAATASPVRDEEVAALLPNSRTIRVKHGVVDLQVDSRRYCFMAAFLADYLGQKVLVRWMELDCVHVFDAGTNRHLGMAVVRTHALAREVSDDIIEARSKIPAELAAHHKRAKAGYLADASVTPTVQRQLQERSATKKQAAQRAAKAQSGRSDAEQHIDALFEERYK